MSERRREASTIRRPWPIRGCRAMGRRHPIFLPLRYDVPTKLLLIGLRDSNILQLGLSNIEFVLERKITFSPVTKTRKGDLCEKITVNNYTRT
jgi:hypothetical protein